MMQEMDRADAERNELFFFLHVGYLLPLIGVDRSRRKMLDITDAEREELFRAALDLVPDNIEALKGYGQVLCGGGWVWVWVWVCFRDR